MKAQNICDNINLLQAIIKFFEGKAVEAARNLAIRTSDSKRTLGDLDRGVHGRSVDVDGLPLDKLDNGVQSLEVDKDIVLGNTEEGVLSLSEDELDEGFQSLPEDESDEGSQSLPEDELDEGVLNLPLDGDSLHDEQVPSLSL